MIESYISEKVSSYRACGCQVKVKGTNSAKSLMVFIKEGDFSKFEKVKAYIVAQTHDELILNSRFDTDLWADLVPKLLFDCSSTIQHQCPARNMAFDHGEVPQLKHVEIVYKDTVYSGTGEKLDFPVNVLILDAFPNKTFHVSDLNPSLPEISSPSSYSKFRREQQVLVIIRATGRE